MPQPLKHIHCETALHKLRRKMPYGWDLNIYRGCGHGCQYCYAMYSHKYMDDADYFGSIYAKTNIAERLEQELRSPSWKREIVNIGGVTDSYQSAEKECQLMPDILRLLIKYRTPAIISTKSDLILRDYELIDQLSRITYVNIAATITTMDETVRRQIEPGGVESVRRFEMLKAFRRTNASIGLHVMPIIPYLTDNTENLEALCANAKEANVYYLLPGMLYLRGQTRKHFFAFIEAKYPSLAEPMKAMYKTGGAPKEYKDQFYAMLNGLRTQYGLSGSYSAPMKEKMKSSNDQLSLFDV